MIQLDIETKPVPELVNRFFQPGDPFDEASVKLGNVKDPALRAEKIQAARAAHAAEEAARLKSAHDRAALNPLTGQLVVIGLLGENRVPEYIHGDETIMLRQWWDVFQDNRDQSFVFWSGTGGSKAFDPDYMVRRSWVLGVKVPVTFWGDRPGYYGRRMVDAATRYLGGDRQAYCKLTDAADQLGLYAEGATIFPKTKDAMVTGENFHLWWEGKMPKESGTPEQQRIEAQRYLANDLFTLEGIVNRIF